MQIDGKRGNERTPKTAKQAGNSGRKANLCDKTSSPLLIYLAEVTSLNVLEFIMTKSPCNVTE